MTANKKDARKKAKSSGSLMGMRSGMQKLAGTKATGAKKPKWTFPQVLLAVGGVAALLALVYAMRR